MILNLFSQLQSQEILSKYPIIVDTLIINPFRTITTDGTLTQTGTTGTTITTGTMDSMAGINLISIGTIAVLFIIAHLLDRKLNRNLDQDLEQSQDLESNQDQD